MTAQVVFVGRRMGRVRAAAQGPAQDEAAQGQLEVETAQLPNNGEREQRALNLLLSYIYT